MARFLLLDRLDLRHFLAKVGLLAAACATALAGGELAVRVLKPEFPGFRLPQVEHRPVRGLGFEMVPNQDAYTVAEPATINAHGLRGPAVRTVGSDATLRVLCIGDSITFGYGVADDVPFPRQLERLLLAGRTGNADVEVINAGVQRYFTYQEIDYLRLKGLMLKPHIVVLTVYVNDLAVRPRGDYEREYEKEREQAASAFRNKFALLYALFKNSALLELAKNTYLGSGDAGGVRMFEGVATERDELRWRSMADELATFKKLADEHGFLPLVVAVPARIQIQKEYPASLYPRRVFELAAREGLESVDLIASFRGSLQRRIDPYLPWDNHLSADGHALVAVSIANRLTTLQSRKGSDAEQALRAERRQ